MTYRAEPANAAQQAEPANAAQQATPAEPANTAQQPEEAVDVLRAVWAAEGQSSADLDDACGPTKSCKNMKDVTFDGMAEPGSDLTEAWRERLRREGKLSTSGGSIRDLVLGSTEAR